MSCKDESTDIGIMGSLYRRALQFYNDRPPLRLVTAEEEQVDAISEVSEIDDDASTEEEEKVLAELDRVVSESRMTIDEATFQFEPKKKRLFLPVAVNLGAVVGVAGSVFALLTLFATEQDTLVQNRSVISTAEGQLLEAVRSQSEAALSRKDQQINDIRSQLSSINAEWEAAQAEAADRLAQEETALRAQLEAELAAEREALLAGGASPAEIDETLAAMEEFRQAEIAVEVSSLEARLQQELAEQEAEVRAITSEYEASLQAARDERRSIQVEADRRVAELSQEAAAREGLLEEERAAAAEELRSLQNRRERESLVLDQLVARYEGVNALMREGDFQGAQEELIRLDDYLADPSVSSLPAIQRRISTETFIISTIREVIQERQRSGTTASLTDASTVRSVATRVADANVLYEAGEVAAAMELYREAVSEFPAIESAVARLEEAEEVAETERLAAVEEASESGKGLLEAEDYNRSLDQFKEALALLAAGGADSEEIADGILTAGTGILRKENETLRRELVAAEDAARQGRPDGEESQEATGQSDPTQNLPAGQSLLLSRLGQIESRLLSEASKSSGPREDLAALLQAKVVARRVLNTEPTRSRYPGLGLQLDAYFDALAEESGFAGRREALVDLLSELQVAGGETEVPATHGAPSPDPAALSEVQLWRDIFEAIETLAVRTQ